MPATAAELLPKFIAACGSGFVVVVADAERDARVHFRLSTKRELLAFIGSGGLERLEFINSRAWENSKIPRTCHAYQFYSGNTAGYVSFVFCEVKNRWFIKSFHSEGSPRSFRHNPFAALLAAAKLDGKK